MAKHSISRLQIIDLRDRGIITPERAADWLSVLDQGGILDVGQKFMAQVVTEEELFPNGITFTGHNNTEIEIDPNVTTREGILRLRAAGLLDAEDTSSALRQIREASKPGGGIIDTIRALFDPTDPRNVIRIGPIPVKAPLFGAGAAAALIPLAAAGAGVPAALGSGALAARLVTGGLTAGGRVASQIGRVTGASPRSFPRLAATGAVGTGTGLAVAGALGGDTPPPESQDAEIQDQVLQTQGAQSAAAKIVSDALAAGALPEEANEIAGQLGVDVQYITRKVRRFNPGTGQIEEVNSIIPIITEQVPDGLGGFITQSSAGAPFFPELAKGQFEVQQQESQRREFIQSLPSLTEFFAQLADPKTANLLRISAARAGGQPTVTGLNLPEQLSALFGLKPGEELPSGVQGGGDIQGSFLSGITALLGQQSPITGPALQAQITPGAAQGLNPEGLGALQAALVGSGTTLEEERRKARTSALPGRR